MNISWYRIRHPRKYKALMNIVKEMKESGILDAIGSDYDENGVPYWELWDKPAEYNARLNEILNTPAPWEEKTKCDFCQNKATWWNAPMSSMSYVCDDHKPNNKSWKKLK